MRSSSPSFEFTLQKNKVVLGTWRSPIGESWFLFASSLKNGFLNRDAPPKLFQFLFQLIPKVVLFQEPYPPEEEKKCKCNVYFPDPIPSCFWIILAVDFQIWLNRKNQCSSIWHYYHLIIEAQLAREVFSVMQEWFRLEIFLCLWCPYCWINKTSVQKS